MKRNIIFKLLALTFMSCVIANAQTSKTFKEGGLSFDYPADWTLQDASDKDAQQFTLGKANSDVQVRIFAHRGRIAGDKLPDAKKAFIDPYIASTEKQFVAMGAKPEKTPDASEIGSVKAEGVNIGASLGGEKGAAKIYWALVGQRVVVLTIFGPDKEMTKLAPAWDLIRNSLQVFDPKAAPEAAPKPTPE